MSSGGSDSPLKIGFAGQGGLFFAPDLPGSPCGMSDESTLPATKDTSTSDRGGEHFDWLQASSQSRKSLPCRPKVARNFRPMLCSRQFRPPEPADSMVARYFSTRNLTEFLGIVESRGMLFLPLPRRFGIGRRGFFCRFLLRLSAKSL